MDGRRQDAQGLTGNGTELDGGNVGVEFGLAATASALAVRLDPPEAVPLTVPEIIRAAWPDHLEERALRIAWRESRWQCCVRTWCCFGPFQIHKMHLAWLGPELGIWTTDQLYDPRTNAEAAYALYQRAGGWGPWAATA